MAPHITRMTHPPPVGGGRTCKDVKGEVLEIAIRKVIVLGRYQTYGATGDYLPDEDVFG